jgi:hypothetical protein
MTTYTDKVTKRHYKLQQILAVILMLIGVISALVTRPPYRTSLAALFIVAGVAWYIVIRLVVLFQRK